jgi:hypothetical protein
MKTLFLADVERLGGGDGSEGDDRPSWMVRDLLCCCDITVMFCCVVLCCYCVATVLLLLCYTAILDLLYNFRIKLR